LECYRFVLYARFRYNEIKKIRVVSTTLKTVEDWQNSTLISDNVVDEVHKLKSQPGKNILLDGSSVLVHTLIENDLVDEYMLHVYPLVLGMGKRLFPEGKQVNLKLVEFSALPTGVVYHRYQPA
jgi:dihydrofolate reductase